MNKLSVSQIEYQDLNSENHVTVSVIKKYIDWFGHHHHHHNHQHHQ